MNKSILLAATAVVALTAGGAMAASPTLGVKAKVGVVHVPPTALYSQNSPNGSANTSQNFTSGSFGTVYNNSGADDFVVPAGKTWTVKGIDVSGVYSNCTSGVNCGPATSEVVTFYKSKKGKPGAILGKGADTYTLNCTDSAGSFSCAIPGPKGKGLKLKGGTSGKTYWVGVVANENFQTARQWFWENATVGGNNPGVWQNPGGGFGVGCATWTMKTTCLGGATSEWAFDVTGSTN
jgi:hypothetical protein